MFNYLRFGFLLCVAVLFGCSSQFDPATAYKNLSMKEIYGNGEYSLQTGYYSDAIQYYQTLDARYPFGDDTTNAQLHIIYAYYMNDDDINSLAAAIRYIHLHPADAYVDYAYYMKALTQYQASIGQLSRYLPIELSTRDLSNAKKSFLYFSELVNRFPKSAYTTDAKLHMVYLRNVMADHELKTAEFYMTRKAYVAAANRASEIVQHFQQSPAVPAALLIMAKAYGQLGLTELSDQTLQLYRFNHYGS